MYRFARIVSSLHTGKTYRARSIVPTEDFLPVSIQEMLKSGDIEEVTAEPKVEPVEKPAQPVPIHIEELPPEEPPVKRPRKAKGESNVTT